MLKVGMLYRPFYLKKSYEDINEEKILSSLYAYKTGTVEMVISRLINEAVLNHMNLCIDSTIMQMLALNEYLSRLFITNFEPLIFNYFIHYLEYKQVEEIEEKVAWKIEELAKTVDMKTELSAIILKLEEICIALE